MKSLICFILLAGPCFAGKVVSVYSSTEPKMVAIVSDSAWEKVQEGDYFEHQCPGYAGYELLHRSGDLRSWIDVRYQGKTSDLYSATMDAGNGQFPHKANDTVEWRGVIEDKVFKPYAIIYRVSAQNHEDPDKSQTRLVVVALLEGKSKILGTASGKNEEADARKLADQAAPKDAQTSQKPN